MPNALDLPSDIARPILSRPDPWAADLKPFKPYTYRGQGYDIFTGEDDDGDD